LNPERRPRSTLRMLVAAGALLCLSPGHAATDTRQPIRVTGSYPQVNFNTGVLSLRDVVLRQGESTLIRAGETAAQGVSDSYENSTWDLKGEVHIEFEGAVLDADTATVVFADSRLKSIVVRGPPARFSHQLKNADHRNLGRAGTIRYDAVARKVYFADGTWYSDGRNEASIDSAVYDLNDGSLGNDASADGKGRLELTIQPSKRVPPPRTPERSSAQ